MQILKKWLHTQPHQPQAWLFTGLLSLHSALAAQSAHSLLSAQRLLTLAAAVCSKGSFEQERALLLVALSDCHMHLALVSLWLEISNPWTWERQPVNSTTFF